MLSFAFRGTIADIDETTEDEPCHPAAVLIIEVNDTLSRVVVQWKIHAAVIVRAAVGHREYGPTGVFAIPRYVAVARARPGDQTHRREYRCSSLLLSCRHTGTRQANCTPRKMSGARLLTRHTPSERHAAVQQTACRSTRRRCTASRSPFGNRCNNTRRAKRGSRSPEI